MTKAVAATTLAPLSQAGRLRCLQHLEKHCGDLWEGARHKMDEARQVSHFPLRGWCLGLPDQRNPVGGWERVRWREGPLQKPTGKIQFGAWRNCRQPVGLRNRKNLPQAARWTTENFLTTVFLVFPSFSFPFLPSVPSISQAQGQACLPFFPTPHPPSSAPSSSSERPPHPHRSSSYPALFPPSSLSLTMKTEP